MPAEPAQVVRSYLDAFASADPQTIAAHVSDDFFNEHTSAFGESCTGKDQYLARLPGFLSDFSGVSFLTEDVIAQDQTVMATYTMTATWKDKPVSIRGVMRLVVQDGLITHRTEYYDSLTFLRQVGLTDQ